MQETNDSIANLSPSFRFKLLCFFEHNYFSDHFNILFEHKKREAVGELSTALFLESISKETYKSEAIKIENLLNNLFSEWKGLRDIDNKSILYIPKRSPRNCSKK